MREVMCIDVLGRRLVGTHHRPETVPAVSRKGDRARIGIVMLNPGYLPRATRGDLGAHLGDHLARLGFPVFRFDMPGLGDSPGDLAPEVLEFFELVQNAGHEPFLNALRQKLLHSRELDGIIFLGHCGGATTAVYAAEKDPSATLVGLILLDPAFLWYRPPPKAKSQATGFARILNAARNRIWDARKAAQVWSEHSVAGGKLRGVYGRLKRFAGRIRRKPLPGDANVRLIRCWERLLGSKKPLLVLTAEPAVKKPDYFDYLGYLQQKCPSAMTRINVPGTSHSFVEGNGKDEVFNHVQRWLDQNFPCESSDAASVESGRRAGVAPEHVDR